MTNTVTPRKLNGFGSFVGVVLGLAVGAISTLQLFNLSTTGVFIIIGAYILSGLVYILTVKKPTSLLAMFMLTAGLLCPAYIILLLLGVGTLGTHFAAGEPESIEDVLNKRQRKRQPEPENNSTKADDDGHEPTLFEIILDPNNDSPVEIYNSEGTTFVFDQVAYIPYNDKQYVLLTPKFPIEGIGENQAVTFEMRYVDGDERLFFVEESEVVDAVFSEYEKLFDENN
jgi:hypothetical protein